MTLSKLLLRLAIAVSSFAVVSGGLIIAAGALAMAVDWDLPEGDGLVGPSSVFDRNLVPITALVAEVERREVPLEDISMPLQQAVIAKEDHRFYEHEGVDPFSVVRAVWRNVRTGGLRQGGSTLTQQYVKNVYVGSDRTFNRKIREAVLSLQLEKEWSKEQILEAYLNRVYFGDGAYGAEAAARTYFGKPAAEVTVVEAAVLASVLNAPSRFSPRTDFAGATQRRNLVLDLMAQHGFITKAEAEAAKATELVIEPRRERITPVPYFVEEVRRQLLDTYGPELVYYGGLHVITTIDLEQQAKLDAEVRNHLPDDPALDAGVVALDPATGDVLAAYSGRDFAASQVDLAFGRGGIGGRPTGSTFKAFVLAAALEEGKTLSTRYPAPQSLTMGDHTFRGGGCGGRCTLQEAIVRSINTVFVQLSEDVGRHDVAAMAHRLGVRRPIDPDHLGAPMALGTASLAPIDVAASFATFANDGVACPPRVVSEVRNPAGPPLVPPDPRQPTDEQRTAWAEQLEELGYDFGDEDLGRCYRAIAPSIARQMNHALSLAVTNGTGRNAIIGRPQAGKTGTTNNSAEVWFAGYTPELSMAVFLGRRDDSLPLGRLPGCRRSCQGGEIPARIWRDAALALLADIEPLPFPDRIVDERLQREGRGRELGPRTQTEPETPEPIPTEVDPQPSPSPTPTPTEDPSPTPTPDGPCLLGPLCPP